MADAKINDPRESDWENQYDDYDDDPGDCFECGGEGFVWDCFDGLCVNAEDGCDDCTRPCPECARRKRPPPPPAEGEEK